jgi:hypothetical protein
MNRENAEALKREMSLRWIAQSHARSGFRICVPLRNLWMKRFASRRCVLCVSQIIYRWWFGFTQSRQGAKNVKPIGFGTLPGGSVLTEELICDGIVTLVRRVIFPLL